MEGEHEEPDGFPPAIPRRPHVNIFSFGFLLSLAEISPGRASGSRPKFRFGSVITYGTLLYSTVLYYRMSCTYT